MRFTSGGKCISTPPLDIYIIIRTLPGRDFDMYVKVHDGESGKVVAACDKELVGKILEEGDKFLDLDTYRNFYVGEISEEGKLKENLAEFASANLVGSKSVGVAVDMGIANENDIMYINETPYIQIYKI
jgi:hypothetical protein